MKYGESRFVLGRMMSIPELILTFSYPICLSYNATLPNVPREVSTMSFRERCPLFIDLSLSSVTNIQVSKLKPVEVTLEAFKNKQ